VGAVHVVGVLLGSPAWPPALVVTLVLLAGAAAIGGPPRWIGPVALAPLVIQAVLTVPRVHTGRGYQWLIVERPPQPPATTLMVDALDTGFRLASSPPCCSSRSAPGRPPAVGRIAGRPPRALPAPVPALTVALQLTGYLLLTGLTGQPPKPVTPYGG